MSDLTDLIAKVRAGDLYPADCTAIPKEVGDMMDTVFSDDLAEDFTLAYDGSLDAALRLFNAVLLGWLYTIHNGIDGILVKVCPATVPETKGHIGVDFDGNPARAMLLAILKAMNAKP